MGWELDILRSLKGVIEGIRRSCSHGKGRCFAVNSICMVGIF